MITKLIMSINGVSRVSINIPEKTINIAYDSRITDAYFIQITLLKTKYKTVEKLGRIF